MTPSPDPDRPRHPSEPDQVQIRPCGPADWPTIVRIDELAFGYSFETDPTADVENAVFEVERTLLASIGGEPAGITSAFSLDMSAPGGTHVPVAGVTWVGVVPTQRRRGVMAALMSAQLDQVHERREPVAALWASEPGIYGRFGYGPASRHVTLTVTRGHGTLDGPLDPALTASIVPAGQAQQPVGAVYDRVRAARPGMPARDGRWWARCTNDPPGARAGASELRALVVGDAETPRAYALWSASQEWSTGSAEGRVAVREALSADAAASRLLWQTLFSMDLVGAVSITRLPVDDPLLHQLRDPRRAHPELRDALYVRLVDVAAALPDRGYDVAWQGVVDVVDHLCPWNHGRWRLSIGPDEATVERTDAEPDLLLPVGELGAAYLGGTSLLERAAAGFVAESTPGAVAGLWRALRSETLPFCPFVF